MTPDEPSESQQNPPAEGGSSAQGPGGDRPRYRSRRPRFRRGGRGGRGRSDDRPDSRSRPPAEEPRGDRPPGSIQDAIAHTREIQSELESVLEDINEVLRILEVAEREKTASEDEVESLRENLRRLQRDRGGSRPQRPSNYQSTSTSHSSRADTESDHGSDEEASHD